MRQDKADVGVASEGEVAWDATETRGVRMVMLQSVQQKISANAQRVKGVCEMLAV